MFLFVLNNNTVSGVDDGNAINIKEANRSLILEVGTVANASCILINEVQYNPNQSGIDSAYEWFELYNACNETVELVG